MALRPKKSIRFLSLALFCALPALSQTLAHRNWEGSGLTAQSWWTRATFCDVDPRTDPARSLHAVTARLDDLQSLGCDALVLDIVAPPTAGSSPAALSLGTLDDADDLIDQMGRRKLRLILPLAIGSPADTAAVLDRMRFWLSRGVAGFLLRAEPGSPSSNSPFSNTSSSDTRAVDAVLHQAHLAAAAALGTRVLIAEGLPLASPTLHRPADVQLGLRRFTLPATPATLHAILGAQTTPLPLLAVSPPPADTPLDLAHSRLEATILLANGTAALLPAPLALLSAHSPDNTQKAAPTDQARLWIPEGGDPLGPPPRETLLLWYRALAELRHTSPALRTGEPTYLDRDDAGVLSWIVRPKGPGAPLLIVCNLSPTPAHLSLSAETRALAIRGRFLRTVLTSDPTPPHSATLDAIDLPADGVFIGEIR